MYEYLLIYLWFIYCYESMARFTERRMIGKLKNKKKIGENA
jgi:hypothetical protein